jgi:hypothetical protein
MDEQYVINHEGFLVDPNTGEVIDDLTYRFVSQTQKSEVINIKKTENEVQRFDTKKYLSSYLPKKLREEFLSRVDEVSDNAEIFAHFILLCREYGIIFDFDQMREDLKLSKITLRRMKKKLMMQGWVKPWERTDPIFFRISEEIDKKNWLPSVLLAIEYRRQDKRVSINEIKKHLMDKLNEDLGNSHFLKYLIRNDRYSILGVYRYFICPHNKVARIDHRKKKKEFRVAHLDGSECFYVSERKVLKTLSKMELHCEVKKDST